MIREDLLDKAVRGLSGHWSIVSLVAYQQEIAADVVRRKYRELLAIEHYKANNNYKPHLCCIIGGL